MDSLASLVHGNRVCNYSAVVAMTFTLYDWMSTAEEEATQIWTRPWTNLKSLYAFIRLLSVGTQIVAIILTLQPSSADSLASVSDCRGIIGFQGASTQILMMAVQAILLLRVEALYQREKRLKFLLRALYIGEFISMTVIFATELPDIRYGLYCLVIYFPPNFATPYFLLPIVIESILFVLTMIKFYEAVRDGWARQPLVFRFLQDGIWAFALPLASVALIINTVCIAVLPGPFSSIAYSWVIAIPGFAGCRLILNMSHLLKMHPGGPLTYPEQDFQLDTEIMTWDRTTTGR